MSSTLYPNAQIRFQRIVRIVRRASSIAVYTASRSPRISVTSDASMATSVPVPMAIPTSACASAGASLIPSPTITMCAPPFWRCSFFTRSAFCDGSTSAITSSIPTSAATAWAPLFESPETMATGMPRFFSSSIAVLDVGLIGSEIAITAYTVIAISDPIKPTSKTAIELLKKRGIPVAMVSGDSKKGAQAVAAEVGIDEVIAEVLPSQKADLVKKLQRQNGGAHIVMVGDGINDAPALAQADVGIAIGTGTDVAMEASDVTLLRGDLLAVYTAIELARRTMRTIRWNLIWAFGYNVLLIPIAAGALYPITGWLLSPVLASAAMAWSSLSVVLNSLTLRAFKTPGAASHALLPQN